MAAASGGQGGGFRADGGAVAFVPPRDWPAGNAPPPPLIFDRVDLDGRPNSCDEKRGGGVRSGGLKESAGKSSSNGSGGGGGFVVATAGDGKGGSGRTSGPLGGSAVAAAIIGANGKGKGKVTVHANGARKVPEGVARDAGRRGEVGTATVEKQGAAAGRRVSFSGP